MTTISDSLKLPCGAVLPNRIAKAAMTEGLADGAGRPTPELERLYSVWSDGGAGLLLSGNVQIDRDHLERPGNVILDREPDERMTAALTSWAKAATRGGNHFWAQIGHAGRQTMKFINPHPKAPSAVRVGIPGGQFGEPVALTVEEIQELVKRFAVASLACKNAGFTGVQVHSAHGYLLSSFLSPRTNVRTDEYGGTLENRARALLDTVKAVRAAVGSNFPIGVKLNSADFQRGGFAFEDSLQVAEWLSDAGIDLLEISGGNYEQPKLLGLEGLEATEQQHVASSTIAREAYFVDFAIAMQERVKIPLMVTGGFRSRRAMDQALDSGAVAVLGLGRPLCPMPDAPKQLFGGIAVLPRQEQELSLFPSWLAWLKNIKPLRAIDGFAVQYWYYAQIYAIGRTGKPLDNLSVGKAWAEVERTHKRWMKNRS